MSPTGKPDSRCAICGGELRDETITHQAGDGTRVCLFEHVPAQVCAECGEVWIEEAVLRQIDRLKAGGQPVRCVETPVFDLALPAG